MRVVELDGEQAARVVADWGYPRAVEVDEINESKWFSYGPHVVWWLNRYADHVGRELALHICVDPAQRRRIYPRKLLYAFEIVAEMLHADRLLTWLEPGAVAGAFLARMGWEVLPDRGRGDLVAWSKPLEGEGHGWWG